MSGTNLFVSFSTLFFKKKFLLFYSDQRSLQLSKIREIVDNMYIVTVCEPHCDVMNFETNLNLSSETIFLYMTKKSRQIFKYLENKKCI